MTCGIVFFLLLLIKLDCNSSIWHYIAARKNSYIQALQSSGPTVCTGIGISAFGCEVTLVNVDVSPPKMHIYLQVEKIPKYIGIEPHTLQLPVEVLLSTFTALHHQKLELCYTKTTLLGITSLIFHI